MLRSVLIADDNEVDRTVLSGFLQDEYEVLEAKSGTELLLLLEKKYKTVSAVILDISMPDMSGLEVLKRIRKDASFMQIPVIIATASSDEKTQEQALTLGANGFVSKPFNMQILKSCIRNAISLRESAALANDLRLDKLTGLLNRDTFYAEAEKLIALHPGGTYMMSCVDIENFKVINDQFGMETGDRVLLHVAQCIGGCISQTGGIACRFTADRFAVLYPAHFAEDAVILSNHDQVSRPDFLKRRIRVRIGRCLVTDNTLKANVLFDRATIAEESIKDRYDAYIADYQESMRGNLIREQQIVNSMDYALEHDEFKVFLQPQINHVTGAMIGAEALVRWERDGSYVSPGEFIPIFERNGFIYEMDQYVWEQVCRMLRRWLDEGLHPLPISVNISRRDIFHKHFISVLTALVKKYDIPVHLLRLEVTESAFADSTKTIVSKVDELIQYGFTVEIDDFGSGYSSLNTLKDVPASILKLDMKFFESTGNNQRSGNIVESVVRMAKWLGMAVIAEGVEDQNQADYLKSIGCYYIQGFLYSKPVPVKEYEQWLSSRAREPKLTRLEALKNWDNSEFWNPKSMETLIFNSYVGGACIFEFHNGKAELLRVNEQYTQQFGGLIPEGTQLRNASIIPFLDQENRDALSQMIHKANRSDREANCEVKLTDGTHTEYVRVTVRVIARAGDRLLYYAVFLNVTEQREAEIRQMESARQLEVIMGNINGGVSAILIHDDGTSRFVFNNEKYYELYGYTREQAMAEKLDVLTRIDPEDFPEVMKKIRRLKADHKPVLIDYRIRKRNGERALLRANVSLMSMRGYGDEVITSVLTDITEIRSLEDQLRAIVDNINGAVSATIIRNGEPEFVIVNDRFFHILGYDTRKEFEKACGIDKYARIHPEDKAEVIHRFESSDDGKKQYTMEYRVIRRDGEIRYIRNNTSVISMFGIKEPVQLSVANDITEQHVAEVRERNASAQLRAIIGNIHGGVTATVFHDAEHLDIIYANDGFYEMYGYTRETIAAEQPDVLNLILEEDRKQTMETVARIVANRGSATYEYRCRKRDGSIMWTQVTNTVTSLDGVGDTVLLAVATDITAEKETALQLRYLNRSARDILAQPDSEAAIRETLGKLLAYHAAQRSYVVELDYNSMMSCNTYEVCADGVPAVIKNLQFLPFDRSDFWYDTLSRDQFFCIKDISDLSEEQSDLYRLLSDQGIRSIILAPLYREGTLIGFVGADNPQTHFERAEQLSAMGDYISILLTRRDMSRRMEQKNAELRRLVNDTPGGFCRMEIYPDKNPTLVSMNEGFCRLLGMTEQEVRTEYGDDMFRCLLAQDIAAGTKDSENSHFDGGQFTTKCRLCKKNGDAVWVTVYGRFVTEENGKVFLNSYFSDLTGQMETEEKLRYAEEEYRLACEQSNLATCRYNIAERTIYAHTEVAKRYGIEEEIHDVPYARARSGLISEDTVEDYIRFYENIGKGEKENHTVFRRIVPGGSRWISAQATTVFSDDGKPTSAIISYLDVTRQKENELLYRKWEEVTKGRNPESYTLFRCNLNKNTSFDIRIGSLLSVRFDTSMASFYDRTLAYARQYVDERDCERYLSFVNSDTMLAEYYRGHRSDTLEYREKISGGTRHIRLSVDLVESPDSAEIEAYMLYELSEKNTAE